MPQVIVETGADTLKSLMLGVHRLLGAETHRIDALRTPDAESLNYRRFSSSLSEAAAALESGSVRSIMVQPERGSWWIMVFCPMFAEDGVPWWTMMIEFHAAGFDEAYRDLRAVAGLRYIAIVSEEDLDLTPEMIDERTFPWDSPRLIRASVRDSRGSWVERTGASASST
jgi:hypothetical protein